MVVQQQKTKAPGLTKLSDLEFYRALYRQYESFEPTVFITRRLLLGIVSKTIEVLETAERRGIEL